MYSLKQIIAMNNNTTDRAENEGLEPYIAKYDRDENVRKCPKLGDYIPENWELVNTYFVDNSGFGSENEPALTFEQFLTKVRKDYGYGIGECGQFQIYINEYRRK